MEKADYVKILQDVVQIESVNGNEKAVAQYYQQLLRDHDISSELIEYSEGRSNLVAEIENGPGKVLALSGHMDVVSAGDETHWTHLPFSAHIENEVMWGRGTSDMKSGLTALVIAFIELKESLQFKGKVKLLATVGEEVGELGSKQLTDQGYLSDVNGLLIGEPCNVGVVYAHKGSLNYRVISEGVAAHSSSPELGVNAIEHLSNAIELISTRIKEKTAKFQNDVMGSTFHNVTLIQGGTQVNSIPDYAEFEANARTIPEFDNEDVMEVVKEVIDELNQQKGFNLTYTVTANQPPVQANPHSELIQAVLKVIEGNEHLKPQYLIQQMNQVLGEERMEGIQEYFKDNEVKPITVSGTTDAAQFLRANNEMELAVYGPGMPMLNHKIDERIPIAQYLDFIEAYKAIISEYLA